MSPPAPGPDGERRSVLGPVLGALAWPAVLFARALMGALATTYRFEVVEGAEHVAELEASPRPVVLALWHDGIWPGAYWLVRDLGRGALRVTFLISHSRDGELVSRLVRLWGGRIVRGSASRGGRQAMRTLYRAIRNEGASPIAIPDGPRGPAHVAKPGSLVLAQVSEVPILPLGCAAEPAWRLKSWDRLIVPRPFARVAIAVGAPRSLSRELGDDGVETERARLEEELNRLASVAQERLGDR